MNTDYSDFPSAHEARNRAMGLDSARSAEQVERVKKSILEVVEQGGCHLAIDQNLTPAVQFFLREQGYKVESVFYQCDGDYTYITW